MIKFKPTTPGRRHRVSIRMAKVTNNTHNKSSTLRTGGRSHGRLSTRGRGGGAKHHRIIVSDESLLNLPSLLVLRFVRDSRRSAPLIECRYVGSNLVSDTILLTSIFGVIPGSVIRSGILNPKTPIASGNRYYRKDIPIGSIISLVSFKTRPVMARAAGAYAILVAKESDGYLIRVKKRLVKVPRNSHASIGRVAGIPFRKQVLGKAGAKRWLGRRPKVRGSAMNPVDHPMGGGEGKSSGGIPKSPFGKLAKGGKK